MFLNLGNETDIPIQETQRFPNKMNLKGPTQRHIIIKLSKVKDKKGILKAARERQLFIYKENPHKSISRFLKRNFAVQREYCDVFKVLKEKTLPTKILCPTKLSFRIEGAYSTQEKAEGFQCN